MILTPVAVALGGWINSSLFSFSQETCTFIAIYIYSSWIFSPDLDHPEFRPGKHSFPFPGYTRTWIKAVLHKCFTFLKPLGFYRLWEPFRWIVFTPLNALRWIWNQLWIPYAYLLTHRGISHLPVIGLLTRLLYLWGIIKILIFFIPHSNFSYEYLVRDWKWMLPKMIDGRLYINSILLPIYISDILHSLVDAIESFIKGTRFCSYEQRTGLLARIFHPRRR